MTISISGIVLELAFLLTIQSPWPDFQTPQQHLRFRTMTTFGAEQWIRSYHIQSHVQVCGTFPDLPSDLSLL